MASLARAPLLPSARSAITAFWRAQKSATMAASPAVLRAALSTPATSAIGDLPPSVCIYLYVGMVFANWDSTAIPVTTE